MTIEKAIAREIDERGIRISAVSEKTGVRYSVLQLSLRGQRELRAEELLAVCAFLGLNPVSLMEERETRADMRPKEQEDRYAVNKRMREAAQRKRVPQVRIAEETGMSEQVVSNIMRCKRMVYAEEIKPICNAIGITVSELYGE